MRDRLPEVATLLRDAAALGVELNPAQAARVLEFGELLLRWNRVFNLISRKDVDRLYHRHLLDSLSLRPWLSGRSVLDLGTGAGLPGIPLAIADPDRAYTLIDRSERKIRFVRQAIRQLRLSNVEARCGEVTVAAAGSGYDVVVTRAVAGAAEVWRLAQPALDQSGRLLAMASAQSGSAAVRAEALPAEARVVARETISIPGLPQPHGLLIMERAEAARPESTEI